MIEIQKVKNGYTVTKKYWLLGEKRVIYIAADAKGVESVVDELLTEPPNTTKKSKTIELRAAEWALGEHAGSSSKTIARHMLGISNKGHLCGPPADAADRDRCIRLLELIPEWVPRLHELAESEPGTAKTVNGDPNHNRNWKTQIPLILEEGNL